VIKVKPNPVTHLELHLPAALIMVSLHNALRLKQPFLDVSDEDVPIT
jgi:hypothetical protein